MKLKKHISRMAFIAVILAMALAPSAGLCKAPTLVSTQWLQDNLGAGGIVILDVREASNYEFAHIPGAVSIPYGDWEPACSTGCYIMAPEEKLTELLQNAGVNAESHVVIYHHGNTVSDASKAGAAFWILQSLGHKNVSMLNGGFTKWTFEGRIVDNKPVTPARGNFVAKRNPATVASFEDIKSAIRSKKAVFVDARSNSQHFGHDKRADVECYGHIPYSVSLPADFLTNAGINRAPATLKSRKDLEKIVTGVGIPADKSTRLIVYCNTAQLAGLDYVVLREILGYRNVRVYDGSMLEYCKVRGNLPVERFAWGQPGSCPLCEK